MGVIVVIHAEVGELTRGNRSHSELLQDSVFFYNALYRPPSDRTILGTLVPIALPAFDSLDWSLPDMATTELFRAKMRLDFHNSMRPSTGSKQTHLSWFMPIGVFVDLFYIGDDMRRTNTMFVYDTVTEELCSSLMDKGWNTKITRIRDMEFVKTTIAEGSLKFRYHISRATLYANFIYNRHMMLPDRTWEAMEQYEPLQTVVVHCEFQGLQVDVEVGMTWTVHDLRQEIQIQLEIAADFEFDIWIVTNNVASKVNARNEMHVTIMSRVPPKMLRVVQRS